jgi:hypothetical protein
VIAGKGCDSDKVIEFVQEWEAVAVRPPKSNRNTQPQCDRDLYKRRKMPLSHQTCLERRMACQGSDR